MSEEADVGAIGGAVLVELSVVPYWVEPALEHTMGKVAGITALAMAGLSELHKRRCQSSRSGGDPIDRQ